MFLNDSRAVLEEMASVEYDLDTTGGLMPVSRDFNPVFFKINLPIKWPRFFQSFQVS